MVDHRPQILERLVKKGFPFVNQGVERQSLLMGNQRVIESVQVGASLVDIARSLSGIPLKVGNGVLRYEAFGLTEGDSGNGDFFNGYVMVISSGIN